MDVGFAPLSGGSFDLLVWVQQLDEQNCSLSSLASPSIMILLIWYSFRRQQLHGRIWFSFLLDSGHGSKLLSPMSFVEVHYDILQSLTPWSNFLLRISSICFFQITVFVCFKTYTLQIAKLLDTSGFLFFKSSLRVFNFLCEMMAYPPLFDQGPKSFLLKPHISKWKGYLSCRPPL